MAKRLVNYFKNLTSDEELDQFLLQDALIILDVYQDIYGPCTLSLHATLEKAKLSLPDSDMIQLAICDAGKIEKLRRFRFKSNPTIVFCDNKQVVEILYQADIPMLQKTIRAQFEAREKNIERQFYEFEQPLPFEQIEIDRIREELDEADRVSREMADAELKQQLDEIIELMAENSSELGITLFMPHVFDGALKKTLAESQRLLLNTRARKMVQITQSMMKILNYKLENPIDDDVMNYLYEKDLLIVLWSGDARKPIEDQLNMFVKDVSEPPPAIDETDEQPRILEPLTIYLDETDSDSRESSASAESGEQEESEMFRESSRKSSMRDGKLKSINELSRQSNRRTTIKRPTNVSAAEEVVRPMLVIPPVWTPLNQTGNFMFMLTFFRQQFEHFLPPIEEPEPPHVCMIFSASDRSKLFEICENFPKQLLASGFFSGEDLNDCKLICKTAEKYDELPEKSTDKIIMKVARKTSKFELALSAIDPVYVSQNTLKGAQECSLVFTESFHAIEDVLNPKPVEVTHSKPHQTIVNPTISRSRHSSSHSSSQLVI